VPSRLIEDATGRNYSLGVTPVQCSMTSSALVRSVVACINCLSFQNI